MRRTRREHAWCYPRVTRWSGQVTHGCRVTLQESRTEEESRITLTGLAGFVGNTTRIGGHIWLLRVAGVTRMVARVSRQIGSLGSARVTEIAT
jgi:hypothetical protein